MLNVHTLVVSISAPIRAQLRAAADGPHSTPALWLGLALGFHGVVVRIATLLSGLVSRW